VVKAGNALVAGPSTVTEMEHLIQLFQELGGKKIFIDGAFSRQASSRLGDALIFVVGASLSPDIDKVVTEAQYMIQKFQLPEADEGFKKLENKENMVLIDEKGISVELPSPSDLTGDTLFELKESKIRTLYLPNSLSPMFAEQFIRHRKKIHFDLILKSPAHLVVSGSLLGKLLRLKSKIAVLHPLNLVPVCFNPFSPTGHEFDNEEFRTKLQKEISIPLFNVEDESRSCHE
jgi:hypothetical protein